MRALVAGARGRRVYETGDVDAGVWSASVALGLVDDCPTCAALLARVEREAEAEIARVGALRVPVKGKL